jgi:hypothetical protein
MSFFASKPLKRKVEVFLISPSLFLKELLRRKLKRNYYYNHLYIDEWNKFYLLFLLLKRKKEFSYEVKNNSFYLLDKKHNLKFYAPLEGFGIYLTMVAENTLELEFYKLTNIEIESKRILDVGAFIGDTALGFVLKGAKKVIGYEPYFYKIAWRNLKINKVKDVEIRPYAVCGRKREMSKSCKLRIKYWSSVVKENFDIAKVDCEGCEYGLLEVNERILRKIPLWVVEIHGNPTPLIKKFRKAGFREKEIKRLKAQVSIWRFEI